MGGRGLVVRGGRGGLTGMAVSVWRTMDDPKGCRGRFAHAINPGQGRIGPTMMIRAGTPQTPWRRHDDPFTVATSSVRARPSETRARSTTTPLIIETSPPPHHVRTHAIFYYYYYYYFYCHHHHHHHYCCDYCTVRYSSSKSGRPRNRILLFSVLPVVRTVPRRWPPYAWLSAPRRLSLARRHRQPSSTVTLSLDPSLTTHRTATRWSPSRAVLSLPNTSSRGVSPTDQQIKTDRAFRGKIRMNWKSECV